MLTEAEAGPGVKDLCRQQSVSEQTFDRWKTKYGGTEVNESRRSQELDEENSNLKLIAAEQALDTRALKAVVEKW